MKLGFVHFYRIGVNYEVVKKIRILVIVTSITASSFFLVAWFVREFSPKHSYIFFVAGCFTLIAAIVSQSGNGDIKTRLDRALICVGIALVVISYGGFHFLSGVI